LRKLIEFSRNPIMERPLSEIDENEHLLENQWVFFASGAKPTSMRRALAERLAEREAVVIVDRAVSLLRDKKLPAIEKRCQHLSGMKGSWCYQPMHFPERMPGVNKILRRVNRLILQRELNSLLARNGRRIICYDSPTQDHLVGQLGEKLSIYIAVDDLTATVCGVPIRGEIKAEKRLLSRVDKVICVSETLAEVLRSRVPSRRNLPISVIPNGYDERIFDPEKNYPEPSDITHIPRPRIIVSGHISERIDWDGIAGASLLRPNWTWIFLGFIDRGMEEKLRNLLGSRAVLHPPIPVNSVPAWIRHSDACAVPYCLNQFTKASHPLKAIEYLAMGKAVLSTKIPSLNAYSKVIEWVQEGRGDSYANALDIFLSDGRNGSRKQERYNSVKNENWKIKAVQFRGVIMN
jgi:glycosyltransferase involved in cell wall biosynthesis